MFESQGLRQTFSTIVDGLRESAWRLAGGRTLRLDCLEVQAELAFDEAGVPHLSAASTEDLFALQGYVHAKDRLFQLELIRRMGRGRLAELLGRRPLDVKDWTVHFSGMSTVELDGFLRAFGLEEAAKRSMAQTSASYRALLSHYVAGINEFVRRNPHRLPVELRLLGARVEPWTELDCFLVYKAYAFTLTFGWQAKLTLFALTKAFPERAHSLRQLMGITTAGVRGGQASSSEHVEFAQRLAALGQAAVDFPLPKAGGLGSNAWAVSGALTASGKPLLCADPHLPTMVPCLSYFQHLRAPGVQVSGLTAAGVPGVTMGHNEECAFAVTHAWVDDCDLFEETLDGDCCLGPDGWVAMESEVHQIPVRGGKPVSLRIRTTPHGPLISDVLHSAGPKASAAPSAGLALRWTGQDGGRDMEGFWALDRSHSWGEARQAVGLLAAPAYSVVYADCDGHIGYQLGGWVPRRSWEGGLEVLDGRRHADWKGYISLQELPSSFDPEGGLVVSANQPIADPAYPHYISAVFEPSFRADRARNELSRGGVTLARCRELQLDVVSDWAERINRERLQPLLEGGLMDADARLALLLLQGWNGSMDQQQTAPTVFWAFVEAFIRENLSSRVGPALTEALLERYSMPALMVEKMLIRAESVWFEDDEGPGVEAQIEQALASAVASLRGRLGATTSRWTWGRVHRRKQRHLFSETPALGRLFDLGPVPSSGDNSTVCSGMLRFSAPFDQFVGADARLLVDLDNFDGSRWISASGQSGHLLSRHYRDQFRIFVAGEDRPWPFTSEALANTEMIRFCAQPRAK